MNSTPLSNRTILVTGGTGSFGHQFVEIALREYNPKTIRIYSRGEYLQTEMSRYFDDSRLDFYIGDVRDRDRLNEVMDGVDIIVHAAALKHVPIGEATPMEAVKTNILGAKNVIDAALANQVDRVIAISSDKATYPVNLYGATKMVAEKLFTEANSLYYQIKERHEAMKQEIGQNFAAIYPPKFSCCRYGNVVASRGSVIPLFTEQAKKGVLTITHMGMTRFWITLEQGARFVIDRIGDMKGGEIFVPKLPSMKVMDMARSIAPDAEIRIIGIRPGEKLHETLISDEEAIHTVELEGYFIIEPEFPFWEGIDNPRRPTTKYSSDNNERWMTMGEIKEVR